MKLRHRKKVLLFDRILSDSFWKQISILFIALVACFAISFIMLHFSGYDWTKWAKDNKIMYWLLPFYLLIDGNMVTNVYGKDGIPDGWAVFVSIITYLGGIIIFNGMIISILTTTIERRVSNFRRGRIHYLLSGHYVIMGYDEMVPSIIKDLLQQHPKAFVLLLTSANVENLQEELGKFLSARQIKRVIINYGHRTDLEEYPKLKLECAAEIFIVGNRQRPAHDAINVETVDSICLYLEECKKVKGKADEKAFPETITCVFEDLDTYGAFKTTEIFSKVKDLGIEFLPYNYYTGWAKQVFVNKCYKDKVNAINSHLYPRLYGNGISPDDPAFVHIVFVGTSSFAVSLAMEAAQVLHFPNHVKNHRLKTLITFIDVRADEEMKLFVTRNRHFFEVQPPIYRDFSQEDSAPVERRAKEDGFLDVQFEFIKGNVFSRHIQNAISQWAAESADDTKRKRYLSVFLAMANQRSNFEVGMNLPDAVYDNAVPVFIRQDRSYNFVANLCAADRQRVYDYAYVAPDDGSLQVRPRTSRYANVYPFGMQDTAYASNKFTLRCAKLINFLYENGDYASYRFNDEYIHSLSPEQIRQEADECWKKRSVAERWSNIYNAYSISYKITCLQCMRHIPLDEYTSNLLPLSDEEINVMAEVEHNRWNVEKLLLGYRKPYPHEDKYLHPEYEKELTANKRLFIHHDIRPYHELGQIRELDKEFSRYLPWIINMAESYDKP